AWATRGLSTAPRLQTGMSSPFHGRTIQTMASERYSSTRRPQTDAFSTECVRRLGTDLLKSRHTLALVCHSRSRVVAIGTWPATRQPVIDRVPQGKNGPGQASIRAPAREGRSLMSPDSHDPIPVDPRNPWEGFSADEALRWSRVL